ncbi:hypothetical protein [Chryseobacterium sp. GP-SGM7]|uniref:hypothetical protein n=1 Tax=Chryseobacterium sp. GP-SGM7 TaxID=3411323 RepID=UPI003B95E215
MRKIISFLSQPRALPLQRIWDRSQPFYSQILQSEEYAPMARRINRAIYPEGWRGFPLLSPLRSMGRWLGWKINYGEHKFAFRVMGGEVSPEFNARTLYTYSKASITRSVPFALIGEDHTVFGARSQGGLATAGMGGPVRTTHDDEALTMKNVAEAGHLFSGGYLEFRFVEIDGFVYTEIRGGGYNNFRWINQKVGTRLFPSMAKAGVAGLRRSRNLPRIDHSVEDITDFNRKW